MTSGESPFSSSKIDRLCDGFEAALRSGQHPNLRDYLLEVPESSQASLLVELFQLECDYHESIVAEICERYSTAYPKYAAVLRSALQSRLPEESDGSHRLSDTVSLCVAPHGTEERSLKGRACVLGGIWPLSELPHEVIRDVTERMREQTFSPGDALLRQGEPPRCLLVLLEGDTDVSFQDPEGTHEVLRIQAPCLLGEMGILSRENCTATIWAKTPVRALALQAGDLDQLAARHPVLLPAIGRLMAERLGQHEVDALAGKTLQNYRIEHCIGRGGMAMVYLATDTQMERKVALKMMSHRFLGDSAALSRFEREFAICRDLDCANIADVYEHFPAFGTRFIAMELCRGRTLQQLIRDCAPMPQDEVRRIAGQLAKAINHAHGRGIVHRDIKPSNVMIREDGLLKLMDFGLAKSKSSYSPDLTSDGQVLGTIRYMPLEQIEGKSVDHRVDVFSFGCIVYEMLTGKHFLEGSSFLDVLYAHQEASLPPKEAIRAGVDDDLYRVLAESVQKAPAGRILDLKTVGAWAG